jgi:hypothetical protein
MRHTIVLFMWLAIIGAAARQASGQQIWGEIEVPGGVAAARRLTNLGDVEQRANSSWLIEFARKYASGNRLDANIQRLGAYLEAVEYLRQELEFWPDGIALPTPQTSRDDRRELEVLFASMGLSLQSQNRQYRVGPDGSERARERRALVERAGIDVEQIATHLNAGSRVRVSVPRSALPLPLPEWWNAEVFTRASSPGSFMWSAQATPIPLLALVRNPQALFTYLGLMALDADTLGFFARQPRLINTLRDTVGPAFATFSRGIRVRQGIIEVPGGPETTPIWTSLVGRSPSDPERFIQALLGIDGGRLAYFYDTVASVLPHRQAFVLGLHLPAEERVAFVRRIYRKFIDAAPGWDIASTPFDRPQLDPAIALMFVDALPDGTVGPSWWAGLLQEVFTKESWPRETAEPARTLSTGRLDAAWIVEWVFADPTQATTRFGVLRYAQRMFQATDVSHAVRVEMALRARKDMPALALALERMNVRDPALIAALSSAAHRLTLAGPSDDGGSAMKRWQGALALLERLQQWSALPMSSVPALLEKLSELVPATGAIPPGAVAAWLVDVLLPALGQENAIESEDQFLSLVAAGSNVTEDPVTWEGLPYVFSGHRVRGASAISIRRASPGPRLHHLIQLQRGIRRLVEGHLPEDGQAAATALAAVEPLMSSLPRVDGRPPAMVAEFRAALGAFQQASASETAAGRQGASLLIALDVLTDAVVPSICYALAAAPVDAPETMAEAWLLHTVSRGPDADSLRLTAWQLPTSVVRPQGGTAVAGSLLALDLALAPSRLVRVASSDLPSAEWLSELDAKHLVQSIVLTGGIVDSEWSSAVESLAAGRRRVAEWASTRPTASGELVTALRTAGVDPWRTNVAVWNAEHELSGAFDHLTFAELFRLGGGASLPPAWMGPATPIDGCLCRVSAEPRRLDDLRGRKHGIRAALLTDLPIRLAELMHELRLPLALAPALVPLAMQDWLDEARQGWLDDWEALALWPSRLSHERVEQYLLHLVSTDVLTPPPLSRDR